MSFNRLRYDTCFYKENLRSSMSVGGYQMYAGKYDNDNKCRVEFGIVGGNDVSLYNGNIVDLESDLRGQNRFASLCSKYKYSPVCKQNPLDGLPSGNENCNSNMVNLPECKMINYRSIIYSPLPKGSSCHT